MSKLKKLTPALLKRIIAEEKRKLRSRKPKKRRARSNGGKPSNKALAINEIQSLLLLRRQEIKVAQEFKKLYEARKLVKKRLMRRL